MAKAAVAQVVKMIITITITIQNSCFRFTTELSTSGLQASFSQIQKDLILLLTILFIIDAGTSQSVTPRLLVSR